MQKEGKKCVEEVAAKFENGGSRGLKRRWGPLPNSPQ